MKTFFKKEKTFSNIFYSFNEETLEIVEIWGHDVEINSFDNLEEFNIRKKILISTGIVQSISKNKFLNEINNFRSNLNKAIENL